MNTQTCISCLNGVKQNFQKKFQIFFKNKNKNSWHVNVSQHAMTKM